MARLGTAVRRWTQTRSRSVADGDGGSIRTDIALNSDGKLLRKYSWLNDAGRIDFTDGWKLIAKKRYLNNDQKKILRIHQTLTREGFVEVEV